MLSQLRSRPAQVQHPPGDARCGNFAGVASAGHAACARADARGLPDPGVGGRLTLSASGADTGEATESLDAAYQGEALRVAFNSAFLLDLLSVIKSGNVEIALKDAASAAELRPSDQADYRYTCVIMPMRS